jgi:hypothetical protein
MPNELDVSAEIAGLKLKSPVWISSSELTSEVSLLKIWFTETLVELLQKHLPHLQNTGCVFNPTNSGRRNTKRIFIFTIGKGQKKWHKKTRKEHGEAMLEHLEDMQRILSQVPIMKVLKWNELSLQQAARYHVGL